MSLGFKAVIPCNDCVFCIAASVLSEIKFVTEQLMKCEKDFASATNDNAEVSQNFHHSTSMHSVTCQAKPVLDFLRDELTEKQMQCIVLKHISTGVQVQHYVYLRLELRR